MFYLNMTDEAMCNISAELPFFKDRHILHKTINTLNEFTCSLVYVVLCSADTPRSFISL